MTRCCSGFSSIVMSASSFQASPLHRTSPLRPTSTALRLDDDQILCREIIAGCQHRFASRFGERVYGAVSEVELRPAPHSFSKSSQGCDRESCLEAVEGNHVRSPVPRRVDRTTARAPTCRLSSPAAANGEYRTRRNPEFRGLFSCREPADCRSWRGEHLLSHG